MAKNKKLLTWLPLLFLAWLGIGQTLYVFVFQVSGQISLRRLAVSFLLAGGAVVLEVLFLWRRKLQFSTYLDLLLPACLSGLVLLFALPFPNHYLFAPRVNLNVSYENTTHVEQQVLIRWLNNGIADIRYDDLNLSESSFADQSGIHLLAPAHGSASLTWSGRSWEQIGLEIEDPFEGDVVVGLNQKQTRYDYEQISRSGFMIRLLVQTVFYDVLLTGLVYLGGLFWIHGLLVFLVVLLSWFMQKSGTLFESRSNQLRSSWLYGLILTILLIVILLWIQASFSNRFYADDYCYQYRFNQWGWLGASWDAYQNLNGRFMGHLVNFAFFSFEQELPKLGVLSAAIGLLSALTFMFFNLFLGVEKRERLLLAFTSACSVFVFVYLMVPDLYESLFWALSAQLLTSGFVVFLVSLTIAIRRVQLNQRLNRPAWFGLFFVLGVIGAGFIEAESVLILLLSVVAVFLFFSLRHTLAQPHFWKVFVGFPLGAVLGLILVLFSPGNQARVGDMGVAAHFSLVDVFDRYLLLLFRGNDMIVEQRGFLLPVLVLVAFFLGNRVRKNLFPAFSSQNGLIKGVLFFLPFLCFAAALLPSAFVLGYLPPRTMSVPLFVLGLGNFLVFFYFGNQTRPLFLINQIIPLVLVMMVFLIVWQPLINFSNQMKSFAVEWDERNRYILEAAISGENQVEITPYQYGFGTDLFNQKGDWLDVCLDAYYGIDIVPKVNDQ